MQVKYVVERQYELQNRSIETPEFTRAVSIACAVAVNTGRPMTVKRVELDQHGTLISHSVLSITPAAFDFRQVTPEMALRMKAQAAELAADVAVLSEQLA